MDHAPVGVRPAAPGDLEAVNGIYNHYVLTSHATFDLEPTDAAARRRWFDEHDDERHRVLVSTVGDRIAGYASSGPYRPRPAYDPTVETSVYVAPGFVGRGIGSALYTALFDALEHADVHRAVAGITQPNAASVALHEAFGFRLVARFTEQGRKFGRYWDVHWYERPVGTAEVARA
jgi:phosphinothricin acetyltransferase